MPWLPSAAAASAAVALSSVIDTVGARARAAGGEVRAPDADAGYAARGLMVVPRQVVLVRSNVRHGVDDALPQSGAAAPTRDLFHRRAHAVDGGVIQRAGFDAVGGRRILNAQSIGRQGIECAGP